MTSSPDWQNQFTTKKTRHLHMLQTKKLSDCTFLVGDGNDKKLIGAHKLILASASPVFERMFYGNLAESKYPITVPDVSSETFIIMLEYIYTDNINITSYQGTIQLYSIADKYMLSAIKKKCSDYLFNNIDFDNALESYEFAKLYDLRNLLQKCMQIIVNRTSDILNQPNFVHISLSTLMTILDQDTLNIHSEIQLFNALVRFANKRVSLQSIPDKNVEKSTVSNSSTTSNGENGLILKQKYANDRIYSSNDLIKKTDFRKAVMKIRFLTMTPQQFADGPATSLLLNQDEILTFLLLISITNKNDIPVPNGFSSKGNRKRIRNSY